MCHHKMKIYKAQPEIGHVTLKILNSIAYLTFPMLSFEIFFKKILFLFHVLFLLFYFKFREPFIKALWS